MKMRYVVVLEVELTSDSDGFPKKQTIMNDVRDRLDDYRLSKDYVVTDVVSLSTAIPDGIA